jgi:signal transduction histidine kinase
MSYPKIARPVSLFVVALLAVVLIAIAFYQYNILGELSDAVQERMQANLSVATFRFAQEFDRELAHIYRIFQVEPDEEGTVAEQLANQYAAWANQTALPELISNIYWVDLDERHGLRLSKLTTSGELVGLEDWPQKLESLRDEFRHSLRWATAQHETTVGPSALQPQIPGVIVQQALLHQSADLERHRTINWTIVVLNREMLLREIFPALSNQYFSGDGGLDFNVAIVDAEHPETIIYESSPDLGVEEFDNPDAHSGAFRFRYWDFPAQTWRNRRIWDVLEEEVEPRWTVLVKHRAGSLEAAVARVRNRNLAISFGALLLLAGSVLMIIVSTRRAQRLAHQQMEFVAGVSHDLRTPLAVIRSAAENLADAVIDEPGRTKTYGEVINKEGRRLSDMVERVLLFSRIQAGQQSYKLEPVSVTVLVDEAVDASKSLVKGKNIKIHLDVAEDLPETMADAGAIRSAIQNLISNAIKYSPAGSSVHLEAREARGKTGAEIQVVVRDEGEGIPASDLRHIFDPFYRGRGVRDAQVEGSGLGLSLVKQVIEAHGGRVSVDSAPGKGSTFVFCLPVTRSVNEVAH